MPHHHCCILGCRSDSRYSKREESPFASKSESLKFFCVPSLTSKRALHDQWLKMIGRPELVVSRNTRVCSLHFMDGRPSKENPLPTLSLQNVNLPNRRRVRSAKTPIQSREKIGDTNGCERLLGCLKNGTENGALNSKVTARSSSNLLDKKKNSFNLSKFDEKDKSVIRASTYGYPQPMEYQDLDGQATRYESKSSPYAYISDEEDGCSLMVAPETIIHEYKQTQTDFENQISRETQTDQSPPPLLPSASNSRVPLIVREGFNGHLSPAQVFVNFGIDFVKRDSRMMRYYTGFSRYTEFCNFLERLKPKLLSENVSLDCFHMLENELLVALAHARLGLDCQDLAFRSGMTLNLIESIVTDWAPVLEQETFKPWIS